MSWKNKTCLEVFQHLGLLNNNDDFERNVKLPFSSLEVQIRESVYQFP